MRASILLLLAACSDYKLEGTDDDPGFDSADTAPETGDDTAPPDTAPDTDTAPPPPTCPEPDVAPEAFVVDEGCVAEPETGTFTPTVLWSTGRLDSSYVTPVVGQLTDDDGDGVVTAADVPDVVHSSFSSGRVTALDGATGAVHWTGGTTGIGGNAPAIADLDADGWPEVVVVGPHSVQALRGADGSALWTAARYQGATSMVCGALGVWDLDGDGFPEVVLGSEIRDGRTGALLGRGRQGEGTDGGAGPISAVADVDQDGDLEVVTGNALYDITGATLWSNGQADGYPALGNFDADPYGEIVVTSRGTVRLQDHDGTVLWSRAATGARSGPPTIADLDGDGEPEIGVAGYNTYVVLEADGTPKWSMSASDGSGFTGSSVFDFEGDGAAEIVFADEKDVYVLDGATGAAKLVEPRHSSATCSEYPVIADVDNDGHADIVYASGVGGDSPASLTVITDADRSWMPARPVWNQYAYDIVHVEDDGGIPAAPATNWLSYNTYRSGDLVAGTGSARPDARPRVREVCVEECDQGRLRVVVVVGNEGLVDLPAGLAVSAWASPSGTPVLLDTQYTGAVVASGSSSEGLVFTLDPVAVGAGPLELRVDEGGALVECDEEDNVAVVSDGLCP